MAIMFGSPAKRRKTSPTTAIAVSATNSERPAETDPNATDQLGTKRASFQSPTKASLARFNPALIPKIIEKSAEIQTIAHMARPEDSRRESLVQQVLGHKRRSSALSERITQGARSRPETPVPDGDHEGQNVLAAPSSAAAPESLSMAISRAFSESRPIRSPLRPRQGSAVPAATSHIAGEISSIKEANLHPVRGHPADSIYRRALSHQSQLRYPDDVDDIFDTSPSPDDIGEPELPPTPTQLGISPPPEKPRGLDFSSSPSGRRARRAAKEAAGGMSLRRSPLKAHEPAEDGPSEANLGEAPESGVMEAADILAGQAEKEKAGRIGEDGEEAEDQVQQRAEEQVEEPPENEPGEHPEEQEESQVEEAVEQQAEEEAQEQAEEQTNEQMEERIEEQAESQIGKSPTMDEDDPETQERQDIKRSLAAQLQRLQADLKQLESLVKRTEVDSNEVTIDDSILALLATDNPSCLPPFAATKAKLDTLPAANPIDPGEALDAYLNLFAPGNLTLTTTASTKFTSLNGPTTGDVLQNHKLVLTAPAPFTSQTFTFSLVVETNITRECVTSINLGPTSKLKGHERLRSWIVDRLANRPDGSPGLHARDVGSIIWGAGLWWDAVLTRARVWSSLAKDPLSAKNQIPELHPPSEEPSSDRDTGITLEEMQILHPHLTRNSMSITAPAPTPATSPNNTTKDGRKPRSRAKLPTLLVSYNLSLDWIGDVTPIIDICASHLSKSAYASRSSAATTTTGKKTGRGAKKNDTTISDMALSAEKELKEIFSTMLKTGTTPNSSKSRPQRADKDGWNENSEVEDEDDVEDDQHPDVRVSTVLEAVAGVGRLIFG